LRKEVLVSAVLREYLTANDSQTPESGYAVEFQNGSGKVVSEEQPACTFLVKDEGQWRQLTKSDPYQLAMAFIRSEFEVEGDLASAIRLFRKRFFPYARTGLKTLQAYLKQRMMGDYRTGSTAEDIRFHYDRSNEFYRCFLDSRMVYSCGYFETTETSLDKAQLAKLKHICEKLRLRSGDRFLDIGCGWGALVMYGAECYGAVGTGFTLSEKQLDWALAKSESAGLRDRTSFAISDYREIDGKFDKIASVGMFEHVGQVALQGYFDKVNSLLEADGVFLNHGIIRPSSAHAGPEAVFLSRFVFPGAQIVRLIDVIRCAEQAGFEVIDVENLRPHYALTCKAWVDNLKRNRVRCLEYVNTQTYRTWLLYLAAMTVSFDVGEIEIHQSVLVKRGASRPLTRDYMYQ
jgi:cyclopropane-fatty-acyl-phospholipid synthase